MKFVRSMVNGHLLAALVFMAPLAPTQERATAPVIVIRCCSGCHEVNGNSELPYIPRLAGMPATYLESQFANYKAAASASVDEALQSLVHRESAKKDVDLPQGAKVHMVGVAHFVSDSDAHAALEWYASQQPAVRKSRDNKTIEAGRTLYLGGVRSRGLPACQTCHGQDARGTDHVPRLAGQNAPYVCEQLSLFRAGKRHSSTMGEIARRLDHDQINALAAYLQSL